MLTAISEKPAAWQPTYESREPLRDKIKAIATRIYGADGVDYSGDAARQLDVLEKLGFANLPVCMAKTQYSLSDNPALLGRPQNFRITVRDVVVSAGAGFVVALSEKHIARLWGRAFRRPCQECAA